MTIFKMGELFSGPGGLAWGAKTAIIENSEFRIKHEWANDYDVDACRTYCYNILPNAILSDLNSVICCDVRNLNLDALSPINSFAFGFPCNDYSIVGEQKGIHGKFGPLYKYGVYVLQQQQPLWFLAENVGGLRSANEGKTFKKILFDLRQAGYRVYPHLYKFEEYGVPQTRHRIIMIGIREDLPFEYAPPSTVPFEEIDITSKNAIENPPIPSDAFNNEQTVQSKTVVERLQFIKPGENAFNADIPQHLQLSVKGATMSQIYKRLDPNKPSYTVTGSGGGGTHIYHYFEPRALTNRERARLQTFPDTFFFLGSKESVRKQIGMAVPPAGAKVIFEAILRTFAGIEYPKIKCNIED